MESNDASIEGKKINLDLKMYNPGDSMESAMSMVAGTARSMGVNVKGGQNPFEKN